MSTPKSIRRIEATFSPDVLDQIGKDFRFGHGKGVAEWLKNSLDAYLVRRQEGSESRSGGWPVHIHLADGPDLALIDFAGATHDDVKDFLLTWFSTSAAARGGRADPSSLTGGHGNGGKFYMREMWKRGARFCTWLDGRATSLVVDRATDGTCGFWELENRRMEWQDALEEAVRDSAVSATDVMQYIRTGDSQAAAELDAADRGFTAVIGLGGRQILSSNDTVSGRRWQHRKLLEAVRTAPASYRPLQELNIRVAYQGGSIVDPLRPEQIKEDQQWVPRWSELPRALPAAHGSGIVDLTGEPDSTVGSLVVRKARASLTGRRTVRNQVMVIDPAGNPVGSIPIASLQAGHTDHTRFLFCELQVRFPEIEEHVENDRESFRNSPQMTALKRWLRDRVSECAEQLADDARQTERRKELETAARLNTELTKYAQRFLRELEAEVMVDWLDEEGGGQGGDSGGGAGRGQSGGGSGGGNEGGGGRTDTPGTSTRVRRPRFPRILLSGYSDDPGQPGMSRELQPGHPPIYQNEQDVLQNVWWINTSHHYARAAIEAGGPNGQTWKAYHLFMFRDVVQIEHLRMLRRYDAEMPLDQLENELLQRSSEFLGQLTQELAESILE